jgi:hypothetical protein
LGQE